MAGILRAGVLDVMSVRLMIDRADLVVGKTLHKNWL